MTRKYRILLPLIISAAFIAGMYVSKQGEKITHVQPMYFQTHNKLETVLHLIEKEYADSIDKQQLIEEVIPLILEKLDPHSAYITAEEYNEARDPILGSFDGIGIQFNIQNDTVIVVQVISGGPSELVGIKAGDRIIAVNDSLIIGKKLSNIDVVRLLKGPKGTKVSVQIIRKNNAVPMDFVITRDQIPLYSVDASYMLSSEVGYIKISRFAITTPDEFLEHIAKLRTEGMRKIVIDLRDNGGGVLNAAIFLANEFLEKNDLIVYTQGKNYSRDESYADGKGSCKDLELAVLINEYSASASEVFAGAIQDNDRGIIVGRRSFGKGFVNRDFMFTDSSIVRLTVQKFYSPTGRCIQKPYFDGFEAYQNELLDRFLHKEFIEKDSISFPDSLIYTTKKGKTVYGGGGIMPSMFVPLDTVGITPYFTELSHKGVMYDFAFDYADKMRDILHTKSATALVQYLDKNNLMQEFISVSQKHIPFSQDEYEISKTYIKQHVYAYIIRNILGDEGFYPFYQKYDTTIITAHEALK